MAWIFGFSGAKKVEEIEAFESNKLGALGAFRKPWLLLLRLVLIFGFLGTIVFFVAKNRSDKNECWMTYMWGRIGLVRVPVGDDSSYSLFIYGENLQLQRLEKDLRTALQGVPIVFVPGNGGSGYQVRSLGSVLYNKTFVNGLPHSFDMFSLDFNEELSGLSVDYLKAQSSFLGQAVKRIYSLYLTPPTGIIFLGHSMGGVVVRSLLLDPSFDPSVMAAVITLATPHKESPLLLSSDVREYWDAIEKVWSRKRRNEVQHVPVVSLSAGFKDDLIYEAATKSPSVRHFSTTSLDRLWLEADHLCIVWCNQLVRLISRFAISFAEAPGRFRRSPGAAVERFFGGDGFKSTTLEGATKSYGIPEGSAFVALYDKNESFVTEPARMLNEKWRISTVFGSSEVKIRENAVHDIIPTSGLQPFNPSIFDTLSGLFRPVYSAQVKRRRMVYLPVNLTDPTAVFKLILKYDRCSFFNDSKYPTRMIFDIGSARRYSRSTSLKSQTLKLYKIDKNDDGFGHVLIVANPKCNYRITVTTDMSRSFMRPFQKHISNTMALFVAYCIASYSCYICFPSWATVGGALVLLSGIQSLDAVSLGVITPLVIVLYEAWTVLASLLHSILLRIRGHQLSFHSRLVLFSVLSAFAFLTHSFPVLCIAVFLGIRNCNVQSRRNLYCAMIQLSIVPFVVYMWNLTRYKAIVGLFPDHNLISTTILLFRILFAQEFPDFSSWHSASKSFHMRAFAFLQVLVLLSVFHEYLRVFSQSVAALAVIALIN
ncbi:hypothetical protein L596_022084 [Steinernema carpocapsae]|uniref:GPI inositol-deacylase n=1 Tax=Steinernema carpocapsae TaxID=34508 RepID=A0A4U5MKP7_STECR|nr:hypothetical protein L596_022084 [Steinernema carpocapsae]